MSLLSYTARGHSCHSDDPVLDIARDAAAQRGWLGALRDQQIGRAIALIHRDPAHEWTLETMASHIGMSRSAFAEASWV